MAYRENQPFNDNMLRPCPVLDNPGRLTAIVNKTGVTSTDAVAPEKAEDFADKCVDRANAWAPVAEKLWKCNGKYSECQTCDEIKKQ
ncbi:hypothetical protein SDC9_209759 [bioreactor metagenome]|uniref:Uncharacterized protein n=1 Tax=bioreactor metagenome TaxID=1076179 RepID=A0A645JRA3_9ZZZZ